MPIVEISGPALPQDAKDRLAKKITEIIAEEEKKAFKVDTTSMHACMHRTAYGALTSDMSSLSSSFRSLFSLTHSNQRKKRLMCARCNMTTLGR